MEVLVAVEVLVDGLDAACVWNAWQWKCWLMAWMRRVCGMCRRQGEVLHL